MARKLSRYVMALRQHAVVDAWDTSTNTMAPVSYLEYTSSVTLAAATFAASTSYIQYTMPNDGKTWVLTGVSYRFHVQATSAATFDVTVDGAGTAAGAGTSQTGSGGCSLQGTADTTINVVPTTQTVFGAGSALSFKVGSTATTGLAGLTVTLSLQRVT
jgi:hypothetical protein